MKTKLSLTVIGVIMILQSIAYPLFSETFTDMMFNVGDVVRNETANIVGRIVEIDGDTFYIEQENGVEVDFQVCGGYLEFL